MRLVGHSVPRLEDGALLRGQGRFVDDIALPGLLHAHFVRSPIAHARLRGIDAAAARAQPGVHAVFTYADLRPSLTSDRIPLAMPATAIRHVVDPRVLADGEVVHVGEPVALVVADSRALAEDAAGLVTLDLEPLPAIVDPVAGLAPGAPQARLDCPDNLVAQLRVGYGDTDAAFATAAHQVRLALRLNKGGGHSIETRGVLARWDAGEPLLTAWINTQMPHRAKALLVATLGLPEHRVRVIAPDVGGGFGPKFVFHPEELAVCIACRLLGLPVKWIEDRVENFTATVQERVQAWDVEAAADADGRLLAIRGQLIHDHGAYTPYGIGLPQNSATNLLGPYILPAYRLDVSLCLTNMVAATPVRGAGRPQGTFVMERLLDALAAKTGLPRDEARRRNMIPPERMPYRTPLITRDGGAMTYDTGDYPRCQQMALDAAGWAGFPARQAAARAQGRWLGIGLANYVEGTGRGPFESAAVRVGASGRVVVATGAAAQGQGTATMLAQVVAEALGLDPADIAVVAGDTAASPLGLGAFASRQAVTAGGAAHLAARAVAQKARQAVSQVLEVAEEDLELVQGRVQVKGVPGMGRSLAEIAGMLAGLPGYALPAGMTPGLAAAADFQPGALTYCNGTHVAEVEVDPDTATIRILRYVVVHDCGRMINPVLVEGQVIGGVVHGIGMALHEWMRHDADGQPQTVTYADYVLPSADVMPMIEIHHIESPTPLNPLGVKGAGESGTIAAPAVIASAVEDALRPLAVPITNLPITPPRLFAWMQAAR